MIAVLVFRIRVYTLQRIVLLKMNREGVLLRLLAPSRADVVARPSVSFAVLFAVESELAHSRDGFGFGIDPPVDEVEVVSGFVYHESARVRLLAVPTAEVVGAVDGVQEPLKVYGENWRSMSK